MGARKNDISLIVLQDNKQRKLLIESVDISFEDIVGYQAEDLEGMELQTILSPQTANAVENYIEFTNDGNDLSAVLGKVRDFAFLTKLGYETKVNMKINRTATPDELPRFEITVRNESEATEGSKHALRSLKGKQILDKVTGLPDRDSFMREAEFIDFCVTRGRLEASLAIIAIDDYDTLTETHGADAINSLLRELVSRCRLQFRDDDILGILSENRMGVIFLEAHSQAAKIPLNRLRAQVSAKPVEILDHGEMEVSLSIAFSGIDEEHNINDLIDQCEEALQASQAEEGNRLVEVTPES